MDPAWKLDERIQNPKLKGVESLFWYEGPLLQSIDIDGKLYIGTWSDCDKTLDRWILCVAAEGVIESLKAGILPIRDAFTREEEALIVDLQKDGTVAHAWRVRTSDIPDKVLAEKGIKLKPALPIKDP
jgi:hypothetical protein